MRFNVSLSGESRAAANVPALKRLKALFDDGEFTEIDAFAKSEDDYAEVIAGFGTVDGSPVYAFSQDVTTTGGAVSIAQSAKVKKVYDLAVKTGAPVVGIYDSNGVRLNEGVDALAAFGDMLRSASNLSGVVPQISVIAGSCMGTAALAAVNADFVIMSKDAEMYLSGDGGSANEAAKSGIVSIVADSDIYAIDAARDLLSRLPMNNLSVPPMLDESGVIVSQVALDVIALNDLTHKDIINSVFDAETAIEFSADFGPDTYTGLASVNGFSTGVIIYGDEVDADSAAKAARLIRFCDAFAIPVISFVNTATLGDDAASLRYSAMLSSAYAEATTQKITVIYGKAYGAAYIALAGRGANADLVFAWEKAEISALKPDAAVSVIWNDRLAAGEKRESLIEEYKNTVASPMTAASKGHIDDVFKPSMTREKLATGLEMLIGKRVSTLPKKHSNFPL